METKSGPAGRKNAPTLLEDWFAYCLDAMQRSVLFMDALRVRGNTYLDTIKKGEPPVLVFDYETILDGRHLERPVNYDLARILPGKNVPCDPAKRPIVVIDPRAGNGPGIGGSKRDSEIGDAMAQGHPVYFILFHPDPVPGQTLADVEKAEVRFIEAVAARHPDTPAPAVIGNCQAGWAVALLGADRPDLTGPLVLNGAPLSYWSGVRGKNPMRYAGGLMGGTWLASFLADLGNGTFDGAWLEANFENLNPGNTLWSKQYRLYAHIDTEKHRYLTFEKWWDGYSYMTREEIHQIVESLFVGDELEKGKLKLDRKKILNLKNIEKPLLLFASRGDNITPPQQALDWIIKEYASTAEIKRQGKVIVYMLHAHVGHLGIFVGSKVARKEHNEIIKSIEMINALPPGLYEMRIIDTEQAHGVSDYDVRFEERDLSDLMALNEEAAEMAEEEADFSRVAAVSKWNDQVYNTFFSPWVRMLSNAATAETLKQLHPLRVNKYLFSDRVNPFMKFFGALAPRVEKNRQPVQADNPFLALQERVSDTLVATLDAWREARDRIDETLFFALYDNPFMKLLFPGPPQGKQPGAQRQTPREAALEARLKRHWEDAMDRGGYEAGLIRMIMALEDADHIIDRAALYEDERILASSEGFKDLTREAFLRVVHEQTSLLSTNEEVAFKTLANLIPASEARRKALGLARKIVAKASGLSPRQKAVLSRMQMVLDR